LDPKMAGVRGQSTLSTKQFINTKFANLK